MGSEIITLNECHLNSTMQCLNLTAPQAWSFEEKTIPEIRKNEVLVRVDMAAICGSDLGLLLSDDPDIPLPRIPGHEFSGVVVQSYDVSLLGKRVVCDITIPCYVCHQCRKGMYNLCRDQGEIGFNRDGCYAEFVTVPINNIYTIPEGITPSEACLIEPLAVCLYALERIGNLSVCNNLTIAGAGGIGLILMQLLRPKIFCGRIAVVDPNPYRCKLAKRLGADETKVGLYQDMFKLIEGEQNIIIDACGDANVFPAAIDKLAPCGQFIQVGFSGKQKTSFSPALIMNKLLSIKGVMSPHGTWNEAIHLVDQKTIDLNSLIKTYHFSEFSEGIRDAASTNCTYARVGISYEGMGE